MQDDTLTADTVRLLLDRTLLRLTSPTAWSNRDDWGGFDGRGRSVRAGSVDAVAWPLLGALALEALWLFPQRSARLKTLSRAESLLDELARADDPRVSGVFTWHRVGWRRHADVVGLLRRALDSLATQTSFPLGKEDHVNGKQGFEQRDEEEDRPAVPR